MKTRNRTVNLYESFCVVKLAQYLFSEEDRKLAAPQLENIPWWGKNILRRGANERLKGKNILNKINNNSENFKRAKLLPGEALPAPLVAGLKASYCSHEI